MMQQKSTIRQKRRNIAIFSSYDAAEHNQTKNKKYSKLENKNYNALLQYGKETRDPMLYANSN